MPARDIVVVGGSAGGVEAAIHLVGLLPARFTGSVLIALHRPPISALGGNLSAILRRAGPLPVTEPIGRCPLERGHVYLAATDHHLLVEPGIARGVRGPHEHRLRPAIDPLFRSAAVAYRSRVIAVLLSGAGTDGAIGLWYVREGGGVTVAQQDARFRSMPETAARFVELDHVLALDAIGRLLVQMVEEGRPDQRRHGQERDAYEDES